VATTVAVRVWQGSGTTSELKRKVGVTLDADLVSEIEAEGENLSARVNTALRNELAARRRHRALAELLDRLATERGGLDSDEDQQAIHQFMRLLDGPVTESTPPMNPGPPGSPIGRG
jgi:post-segregation antitoxin (ccd killing protein)